MFNNIEQRFGEIIQSFATDQDSLALVTKAYTYAKNLHGNQIRKDGTLYISHPVEVALILSKLGFNEDVVCAGLLHDVVEDCNCDLNTIREEFNDNVAEMVDCVSAIDKEKYIFDKEDLYEIQDFQKASIEEQSFKKLISIGKNNPSGFCIKFADRLHKELI